MFTKVLLVTTVTWPSAPRIAEAFANSGADVGAVHPGGHVLGLSRFVSRSFTYDALRASSSVAYAIENSTPDLVVPLDDRAASLLSVLGGGKHAPVIARSMGNPAIYLDLMSRAGFIAAARAAGIRAPQTAVINSNHDLDDAISDLGLPAAIKSDGTWGGDGVAVVRSSAEAHAAFARFANPPSPLRSLLRAVNRRDAHFLREVLRREAPAISMQSFVSGTPVTTSFACWQGDVLAAIHLEVIVSEGTGPACVVRVVENKEMDDAAAKLARRFSLSGLHGLDFIRDVKGGMHLIEINPRATQTSFLALGEGRDLMAALIGASQGIAVPARPAISAQNGIALFPQEWSRDPQSPWLTEAWHEVPRNDPDVLRALLKGEEPSFLQTPSFTTWQPSARRLQAS